MAWVFLAAAAVAAAAVAAYAWFEAGWLRTRVLEVTLPGLPAALDGVRIGHLSDFHLGAPLSRGNGASERAARWVAARAPELVAITGDLVSHPRGEARLRRIVALLHRPLVVLGNHDVAVTRDPFSRAAELDDLEEAVLLRDEAVTLEIRGVPVQVVGVDAETYPRGESRPASLADPSAPLRILLCHFPSIGRRLPAETFHLTLAGHLHAGQLCVPLPGRGPVTLAHPRATYVAGLYDTQGGRMHVSPGTGTTFVPFRLFARPEVTELVLRAGPASRTAE
jgi:predicted MPP superfamily phosphohydrolase